MAEPPGPVRLGGTNLDHHYHACVFSHSRDEEYELLGPYVREGLEWGEKAVHITDPDLRQDHCDRLTRAGIDTAAYRGAGQLEVLTWQESYLRDRIFNPREMLDLIQAALHASEAEGYPRTRMIGHMEWALEDHPGAHRLLEYEALVNDVLARHRAPAVCVYDLNKFSGAVIADVLRTHPMVLLSGRLRENPFFVPPGEFLQELQRRTEHPS